MITRVYPNNSGFTLVELSIVLLIIGLLTGGVFVGQELIFMAKLHKQMRQIEEYSTALYAFRSKYNGMPGDLKAELANGMGSTARNGGNGRGDGDYKLEACGGDDSPAPPFTIPLGCENVWFWADLSKAGLVAGNFTEHVDTGALIWTLSQAQFLEYFPQGKMGNEVLLPTYCQDKNYLSIQYFTSFNGAGVLVTAGSTLSNISVYNIDTKMDDGMPFTGKVQYKAAIGVGTTPGEHKLCATSTISSSCVNLDVSEAVTYNLADNTVGDNHCHPIFQIE